MMVATRGPAWTAAASASSRSMDDAAGHCFVSDAAHPPSILAEDPSTQADVPPNPPFVFPARLSSTSSAPALYAGQRPASAIETQWSSASPLSEKNDRPRRTVALPAFNFNPGASLAQNPDSLTLLSPPISPHSPSPRPFPSPSRPARHGHRRGGSEFVGGSIRDGNSIAVMSTSPTKSDSGFPSPGLVPPSRGHRASGTVCASDLPFPQPFTGYTAFRGNSAPNSPTSFDMRKDVHGSPHQDVPGFLTLAPASNNGSHDGRAILESERPTTPAARPSDVETSSPKQPRSGRTRVGFSDTLEFIPRPLSLVSSDTSSTTTARPCHSLSGSISSVVSVASPCGRDSPVNRSRRSSRDAGDSRPSTAGAVLDRMVAPPNRNMANFGPRRRNSNPTLRSVAEAQAADPDHPVASVKAPKRWSFFGLESSFINPTMPATKPRSLSSSSSDSVLRTASVPSSDHDSDSTETGKDLHAANADKKGSKKKSKKKRVKGWAGSILPLKPRGQKKQAKSNALRPPTPPASVDPLEDEDEDDDDEEVESADTADPEGINTTVSNAESSVLDREVGGSQPAQPKEEASHPMIDLDAALGPFNTPLPHNAEWEAAQRAAGTVGKRRMHSAQGMKGFSGPGMHYHRRSESAPDLPPFDVGRSSIHRLNTKSAMADVFEEDEDGDAVAASPTLLPSVEPSALLPALPTESAHHVSNRASSEPRDCSTAVSTPLAAGFSAYSTVQGEVARKDPPSIIFCTANASGTDSATSSPKRFSEVREPMSAEVYQTSQNSSTGAPLSSYSTSLASSSHPSPRSPVSTDARRMSTAPSSVTDKNSFQSLLMGEPGPEVRISADYDMRSLASSNSTMTRDSGFLPSHCTSQPTLRDQRPMSVSSAAFGRRRSSLVSLSRLISSAHGERSKLSMEVTLDETEGKKTTMRYKGSKTKERLGRMMQFWKPSKGGAPA